ncbi:organic cation/carnitine transporter 2-like [Cololabis saira]|uniref:organic cation/carnitine transporter 2-like n=1 Tax=Cololabis saira TaxID=129043 RepID=UPI002AD29944|nr:organic cation/carnitine transporter 2-like [Cololabis saira]
MQSYEESTAFLGSWGLFQRSVFFMLCASILPNGFGVFSLVFLTDIPPHHCRVPEDNLTQEWHKAAIPTEVVNGEEELSKCTRYRLDVVRNLSAQGYIPGRDINLTDLEREGCVDGWSYSKAIYQSTIVTEFDLVCSEQWKHPFTSTVYFLGVLIGSFLSGLLSDKFGRKPVLFGTMAIQAVFTFAAVFSQSWKVFAILLFLTGLGQISNYVSVLVLGVELMSGRVQVLFSSLGLCLGYAFGYMLLPLFAYFLRDWKHLLLVLSMSGLVFLPLWRFIPESPRWLLSQGRVEEAEAILRNAAKKNKVEAPEVIFGDKTAGGAQPKESFHIFKMLRTKNIVCTTATLCLLWFSLSTGYNSLSLNTPSLHSNPYVSCFISAAVEVPAYICSWLALRSFPRRQIAMSILLLVGASLFIIQAVPESLSNLSMALEMLGKFGVTTGAGLMFAYTAELYPTVLRNTAAGICMCVSRVGSCIAPFLLHLSVYSKFLPHIILGSLAFVSASAALFLPETFGRPLPQTIHQMHQRERIKCPSCIRRNSGTVPVTLLDNPS